METGEKDQEAFSKPPTSTCAWEVISFHQGDITQCVDIFFPFCIFFLNPSVVMRSDAVILLITTAFETSPVQCSAVSGVIQRYAASS